MDLREKKTKRSIYNAFLQLRAHKALERITVKELAEAAEISKATFYLHYHDIYDLSEKLQREVIKDIIQSIDHPEGFVEDHYQFFIELFHAFHQQESLIDILFEGNQAGLLPSCIEEEFRKLMLGVDPSLADDASFDIALTYRIQGCFYAYQRHHKKYGTDVLLEVVEAFEVAALDQGQKK